MAETRGWPTLTVTIPNYNWAAEVYEPSVAELKAIGDAQGGDDKDKVWAIVSKIIKSWNFTDRAGNPLPVCGESLDQIPPSVVSTIIRGLVNPSADPKAEATG